jgi:hypothetical protein
MTITKKDTRYRAFVYDFYNKCGSDDFNVEALCRYHCVGYSFRHILVKTKLNMIGQGRGVKYTWIGDPPTEELINSLINEHAEYNKEYNANLLKKKQPEQIQLDLGDSKPFKELINETVQQAMNNWMKNYQEQKMKLNNHEQLHH